MSKLKQRIVNERIFFVHCMWTYLWTRSHWNHLVAEDDKENKDKETKCHIEV